MVAQFTVEEIKAELKQIEEALKTAEEKKRGPLMASRRVWQDRLKELVPDVGATEKPVPQKYVPEFTAATIRAELEQIDKALKNPALPRDKKAALKTSRATWAARLEELEPVAVAAEE